MGLGRGIGGFGLGACWGVQRGNKKNRPSKRLNKREQTSKQASTTLQDKNNPQKLTSSVVNIKLIPKIVMNRKANQS